MKKTIIKIATYIGIFLLLLLGFLCFQYFNPGSPDGLEHPADFEIVAHRGAHVMWQQGVYDIATGCEATHIYEPRHDKIENTIPSIAYAFELGATMVEIDIRRTVDNNLMVIHEYDLACKTDGEGLVSDSTVEYLKTLDVGYGFTHDGGRTYPFRGKGVGMMPTLQEVLDAFPDGKFLIHHKDSDMESLEILIEILEKLPIEQQKNISYIGPQDLYSVVIRELPNITNVFPSRAVVKECVMPYILSAGVIGFSEECRGKSIGMNREYAKYVWGWPYGFLHAAQANDNDVYLMVDSEEDIEFFKGLPVKGIVTDYIDVVGPAYLE